MRYLLHIFFGLLVINCKSKNQNDKLLSFHSNSLLELSTEEINQSTKYLQQFFPLHYMSRQTLIEFQIYGCFTNKSESLIIEPSVNNMLLTYFDSNKEKKQYSIPGNYFFNSFTRFNNSCARLLAIQQKEKEKEKSTDILYSIRDVKRLMITEGAHNVSIFIQGGNPFVQLSSSLLRKEYLIEQEDNK